MAKKRVSRHTKKVVRAAKEGASTKRVKKSTKKRANKQSKLDKEVAVINTVVTINQARDMAVKNHEMFAEITHKLARQQKVGMMKGFTVRAHENDVYASYRFTWRNTPPEVERSKLADLAATTLEQLPWDEPPAITAAPGDDNEIEITLIW